MIIDEKKLRKYICCSTKHISLKMRVEATIFVVETLLFIFVQSAFSDVCNPNPCGSGNTCIAQGKGFKCKCQPGSWGKRCKKGEWDLDNLGEICIIIIIIHTYQQPYSHHYEYNRYHFFPYLFYVIVCLTRVWQTDFFHVFFVTKRLSLPPK